MVVAIKTIIFRVKVVKLDKELLASHGVLNFLGHLFIPRACVHHGSEVVQVSYVVSLKRAEPHQASSYPLAYNATASNASG